MYPILKAILKLCATKNIYKYWLAKASFILERSIMLCEAY